MAVTIIHFNTSLILILIGMNYLPDLLHSSSVMNVSGTKQLRTLSGTHSNKKWSCSVHLPTTTATVTEVIHVTSAHFDLKGHCYSPQRPIS